MESAIGPGTWRLGRLMLTVSLRSRVGGPGRFLDFNRCACHLDGLVMVKLILLLRVLTADAEVGLEKRRRLVNGTLEQNFLGFKHPVELTCSAWVTIRSSFTAISLS